jgi:tetratricopeptide (TPR) repeat protein
MRLLNTKAISSLIIAIVFTGCGIHQELVRTNQVMQAGERTGPDYLNADIHLLPIINNPKALTELADTLGTRSALFGQKVYALRLAVQANFIDKKSKNTALVLSRLAFLVADSIEGDEDKIKKSAEIGVKAARSVGINADNPEACYYFALNQGLIVQMRGLFALKQLPEIHEALKLAQKVETLDFGGPLRVLGMMYLKAPAWPTGIGDLDKSLELLEKATANHPENPQNFMFYAEALIQDDNKEKALQNLDIAERLAVPEIWGSYYSKKWLAEIEALKKKASK